MSIRSPTQSDTTIANVDVELGNQRESEGDRNRLGSNRDVERGNPPEKEKTQVESNVVSLLPIVSRFGRLPVFHFDWMQCHDNVLIWCLTGDVGWSG